MVRQKCSGIRRSYLVELAALREFRTKLRRLDLTTAPDIDWPSS